LENKVLGNSKAQNKINWQATLLHPDNRSKLSNILYHQQRKTISVLNIIALDTSGSTLASEQLSEAKAIIKSLSEYFYQQREMMALLCFGNQQIEWVFSASKAPYDIDKLLVSIQAGGGTPLKDALLEIQDYIQNRQAKKSAERQRIFLITDGRSRENIEHLQLTDDLGVEMYVLDCEKSAIKLGKAQQLARTLNANYVNLSEL